MWLWRREQDGQRHGGFDHEDLTQQAIRGRTLLRIMQAESGVDGLIAEDLGTIPDFVRETLNALGIPGYKIIPWERDGRSALRNPRAYSPLSIAAFSTHDTQPIGAWYNEFSEVERQELLDMAAPNANATVSNVDARQDVLMRLLAASGSDLILVQFEELLGRSGRINVPGTVNAQNWSLRLHQPFEDLMQDPAIVARLMNMHRILVETARA
jgi:4-alpha-glucanotransferase